MQMNPSLEGPLEMFKLQNAFEKNDLNTLETAYKLEKITDLVQTLNKNELW